ncbi:MAG: dephospho-CoA kinase [Proteobacteria bacterium]|nr:dephospho-CoA kinase [Pseudomonadota bacterium]
MVKRAYVVGVTGGIGSGKSTVCRVFTDRHGIVVIDADQVAREVVEPGTPALAAIVATFGAEVVGKDGRLDRARLRGIVFADPARRAELEAITHPAIRAGMRAHVEAVTGAYCMLGIPLLAEGGRNDLIDRVLVVDCPEALQVERVRARDHLTEAEVAAIMRTQASREARLRIADDVVVNDGDTASLAGRVDELHEMYLQLAAAKA